MNKGRIEQVGSPIEIYESPRNEFVSSFIGETNILSATITQIKEEELLLNINEPRPITIPRPPDFRPRIGDAIKISIRPEKLCFGRESGDLAHCLLGTVDHVVFLGNITYYTVKTQAHSIRVICQNLETRTYSVGDQIG
jgi:ABC-type Fe3+/spermidine/putrescine transport system ATPase subunit